jgi:hypothetical protein
MADRAAVGPDEEELLRVGKPSQDMKLRVAPVAPSGAGMEEMKRALAARPPWPAPRPDVQARSRA